MPNPEAVAALKRVRKIVESVAKRFFDEGERADKRGDDKAAIRLWWRATGVGDAATKIAVEIRRLEGEA